MTTMRSKTARSAVVALAAACGFVAAADSFGFVPPASFILRRMTGRTSGIRGVQATVAGRAFADENDQGSETSGKLYLAAPDRFRLDTQGEKGSSSEVWVSGTRTVKSGDATQSGRVGAGAPQLSGSVRGAHPLSGLFLGGNVRTYLAERGVDLSQVTLARLDHHLCWIIGAPSGDEKRAQLWISKDSFLPVRFLSSEGEGEARTIVDWRFDDYDRSDTTTAFPRSLELRKNGVRVLRLAIVTIDVHGVPSESSFSPPGK